MSAHSVANVVPIFKDDPPVGMLTPEQRTRFTASSIAQSLCDLDRANNGLPHCLLEHLTPFERQDYERRALAVCRSFNNAIANTAKDAATAAVADAMLGFNCDFASQADRKLTERARQYATKALHIYQSCLEETIAPQTAAELSRLVRHKLER